jgi:hypothetical protein
MPAENGNLAEKLQAEPAERRVRVKEQFVARLRGELDGLLTLLRAKDEQFTATQRIDPTSGEYQAVEILQVARFSPAADLFVRHIATRSTAFSVVSDEVRSEFPYFPFAVAVAEIGSPAVLALTGEILTADPTTTRFQLSCLVLRQILGEELALLHIGHSVHKDPQYSESQRQEQATRFIKMRTSDWEAAFCSDFALR